MCDSCFSEFEFTKTWQKLTDEVAKAKCICCCLSILLYHQIRRGVFGRSDFLPCQAWCWFMFPRRLCGLDSDSSECTASGQKNELTCQTCLSTGQNTLQLPICLPWLGWKRHSCPIW